MYASYRLHWFDNYVLHPLRPASSSQKYHSIWVKHFLVVDSCWVMCNTLYLHTGNPGLPCRANWDRRQQKCIWFFQAAAVSLTQLTGERDQSFVTAFGNRTVLYSHIGDNVWQWWEWGVATVWNYKPQTDLVYMCREDRTRALHINSECFIDNFSGAGDCRKFNF